MSGCEINELTPMSRDATVKPDLRFCFLLV
jgi:hypothetical protein